MLADCKQIMQLSLLKCTCDANGSLICYGTFSSKAMEHTTQASCDSKQTLGGFALGAMHLLDSNAHSVLIEVLLCNQELNKSFLIRLTPLEWWDCVC